MASWPRLGAQMEQRPQVNPVLLDAAGQVIDIQGHATDQPVHVAWHNFEIQRSAFKPFADLLLSAKSLQFVQTAAAGLDSPFFRKLVSAGVTLCNSDAQAPSIAEYVLASVLNAFHDFPLRKRMQNECSWRPLPFRELCGASCVVVGYGNIASRVVDRLLAFEAEVSVVRRELQVDPRVARVGTLQDLPAFLPNADVVVLACALTDETFHLMDEARLALCKDNCVLVNIARGALVDEHALLEALASGKVGRAILDVFEQEPLPQEHPFWSHDGVLVSAHTSNNGSGRQQRGDDLFLRNLDAFLAGQPYQNLIKAEFFA